MEETAGVWRLRSSNLKTSQATWNSGPPEWSRWPGWGRPTSLPGLPEPCGGRPFGPILLRWLRAPRHLSRPRWRRWFCSLSDSRISFRGVVGGRFVSLPSSSVSYRKTRPRIKYKLKFFNKLGSIRILGRSSRIKTFQYRKYLTIPNDGIRVSQQSHRIFGRLLDPKRESLENWFFRSTTKPVWLKDKITIISL